LKVPQKEEEKKVREISLPTLMGYLYPKSLAVLSIFTAFLNAFTFPIQGLIFCKLLFILLVPQRPDFVERRNFWCGMFLLLVICSAVA
jgi:hypothetical protein